MSTPTTPEDAQPTAEEVAALPATEYRDPVDAAEFSRVRPYQDGDPETTPPETYEFSGPEGSTTDEGASA